ncbi:ankyrin repeat domain-containing protein [Sphingomonas lacunae]|uniref:Ankyrin repeat domain-containing protein n=1 Tax=Sphingomonas lacunae TaxID=2698828 RepID=A0A6M4AS36_9SPHN|nr:ankyrin repeat domain-containing protein [Sphingomonas lacunae]QJQ31875.1 ankyrin repeat domain-containing protein [Sphingomonas lacunae]
MHRHLSRRLAFALLFGGMTAASLAGPVAVTAQGSPAYRLLEAVRDRDLAKARELIDATPQLVNTRDITSGETPLLIAVGRQDIGWMNYLLGRGADANIADRQGVTPLISAVQAGYVAGARALIERGARVNHANGGGETALHAAVHRRDVAMVRLLMDLGADADITDNLAGKSPRDYASEDRRSAAVLAAINAPRTSNTTGIVIQGPVQGPR